MCCVMLCDVTNVMCVTCDVRVICDVRVTCDVRGVCVCNEVMCAGRSDVCDECNRSCV